MEALGGLNSINRAEPPGLQQLSHYVVRLGSLNRLLEWSGRQLDLEALG